MKKISVFLLGAILIGVASAFTTAPKAVPQTAYGNDSGEWYEVDPADIGVTFNCNSGTNFCLYDQREGTPLPLQSQDKQFVKIP